MSLLRTGRHWVRWTGAVPTMGGDDSAEVWCRAFTQGGANGQPEKSPQRGGYLYNGWHKTDPEAGHDKSAAEWQAKLDALTVVPTAK